ncbi:MAG: glycosyltransferase [Candidatus Kerfeldbacteria bacterium]|nr:glycosyltransferase [Candidatus Kerfeldbacteria bacterium]
MIRRIVLTGGGTAGSVTPLLALADQLRRVDSQVELLFIGTTDGPERLLVESAGIRFRALAAGKLRRYWSWRNLLDLGNIW